MKRYVTKAAFEKAIERGDIPRGCVSPVTLAEQLHVSRQAIYQRIARGTLRGWSAPGITLVEPINFAQRIAHRMGRLFDESAEDEAAMLGG